MKKYRYTLLSYAVCFRRRTCFKRMDDSSIQSPLYAGGGLLRALIFLALLTIATGASAQDWVRTGSGLGVEKVRLAVPDFKPSNSDPQNAALLKTFNDTFWNDLDNSGIVELISKSFYPLETPGQPTEVTFGIWNSPPPNAGMLAFGNLGVVSGKLTVLGWLYDVKNTASPLVLGKQYTDVPTDDSARLIAH
jgi:TolB protein